MSSFTQETTNPLTLKIENADWIDNYFGARVYGIKFGDGKVYTEAQVIAAVHKRALQGNLNEHRPSSNQNNDASKSKC